MISFQHLQAPWLNDMIHRGFNFGSEHLVQGSRLVWLVVRVRDLEVLRNFLHGVNLSDQKFGRVLNSFANLDF